MNCLQLSGSGPSGGTERWSGGARPSSALAVASPSLRACWLPLVSSSAGGSLPCAEGSDVAGGASGAVLDGDLAERVNRALDDIAGSLAQAAPASCEPWSRLPADLADGPAGLALFFHYLDQARPGMGHDDRALAYLDAAIEAVAEATRAPALYTGFSGVAWTVEHLTGRLLEPPAPGETDTGAAVARVLAGHLRRLPRYGGGFDLFSGLAGLGVWALERAPRSEAMEAMDSVVRHLGEHAERGAEGIAWRTPPEHLVAAERTTWPQGCYKLGVAHGVAGVIGLLGAARSAGLEMDAAQELLAGAVEWLLGQMLPPGAGSCFGDAVAPGVAPAPARLAWCRGDAGIALALLAAARASGEPDWERQALGIARAAAARPRDQARVRDGGLCHGAAGLAHLYNRLFHATGDPLFKAEALAWIERLLAQRQPGRGLAGWLSWRAVREVSDREVAFDWVPVPGLLTGVAGIGLTLLGAVSPVEPAWDRVLLCSVPPLAELAGSGARQPHRESAQRRAPTPAHGPCHDLHFRGQPEKGDAT